MINPNKIAIIDHDNNIKLTYKNLVVYADCCWFRISAETNPDVKQHHITNPFVLLCCKNNLQTVITYLACFLNKIPVLMFDAKSSEENKQNIIDKYKPNIIAEDGNITYLPNNNPINQINWLLLPTSGTTGSSKYVRLSQANVINNAKNIIKALSIKTTDVALLNLPLHYSYGLSVLNSHLLRGSTIVLTQSSVMEQNYWDALSTHKANSISGVPYTYHMLKRFKPAKFESIEVMTQAGGKLPEADIIHFRSIAKQNNSRFYVMYGQTEATARMTVLPYNSDRIDSVGKAIGGRIEVENNELVYYGKNVMLGYANSYSDLMLGDENKGKLYTGDIGEVDSDGFIKITGRNNRYIKMFGSRINLDDIEVLLVEFKAAVVGEENKIYIAYEVEGNIKEKLVGINKSGLFFKKVENLPLKSNGKIDYAKVREFFI